MSPEEFDRAYPLLVAFSVLDPTVAEAGSERTITVRVADAVEVALKAEGYDANRRRVARADRFEMRAGGVRIFTLIVPVDRFADRHQWQLQLMTDPPYDEMTRQQKIGVRQLLLMLADVVVAMAEVEDVDVAAPVIDLH